jgi:hypothetical protein
MKLSSTIRKYWFIAPIALLIFLLARRSKKGGPVLSTTANQEPDQGSNPIPTGKQAVQRTYNFWRNSPYSQLAEVLTAQAMFETNRFKSTIYNRYANSYGMGVARKRKYTRAGVTEGRYDGNRQLSRYYDLEQGLKDMQYLLDWYDTPNRYFTPEEWARYMKQRSFYTADESKYARGLEATRNELGWYGI